LSSKRKFRRKVQKIRRYLVYLLTLCFRRILLLLPFKAAFHLCSFLSLVTYYILARERRKTLANLRFAWGKEKSEKEIREIARNVFKNSGRILAEAVCLPKLGVPYLESCVTIENPERIITPYKEGRGVIGLTAHLGNWEYMAAVMANILKIRFAVIAREYSNPWLNRLLEKNRSSIGVDVIYRGESGLAILRRLKNKEGLGILADQNIRGEGIMVDFFGHPAKTLKAVAELILRTQTPVVPLFIIRNKDLTKHRLIVENPLIYTVTGNKEIDLKNIAESYTKIIEKYVRRFPDQWMWMHNRWNLI